MAPSITESPPVTIQKQGRRTHGRSLRGSRRGEEVVHRSPQWSHQTHSELSHEFLSPSPSTSAVNESLEVIDNVQTKNPGPVVIVRGEEIGIVVVVLLLWVGAIILFFNRWGKIRMLEPYQPKFCETHRPSCPMADVTSLSHCTRSYSKYNLSSDMVGSPHFAKCNYHGVSGNGYGGGGLTAGPHSAGRPRQNSVFVSSPNSGFPLNAGVFKSPSRKTKSAIDLSTLVLSEEFLETVRRNSKNSITHL